MAQNCKIQAVSICFWIFFFLIGFGLAHGEEESPSALLFRDLKLVASIDKELKEELPFFYNFGLVGGYFNMPSARVNREGEIALGGGRVKPYNIYGVNFQVFDRIELSANYRVYTNIVEANFGKEGFGDDADRVGNIKFVLNLPTDGFPKLPSLAFGADDFIGTKRFHSQYFVLTKEWNDYQLELSLGWGKGKIKGLFGGLAWSPLRKSGVPFFKDLSFLAEYDAFNYKKHPYEHPDGRLVRTHFNLGFSYVGWDTLQFSLSSLRGTEIASSLSLRYPLGIKEGFFPKIDDPQKYLTPVDFEPLESGRKEKEFAQQLAYAFADQGLDLYEASLTYQNDFSKVLWLKIANNRYREESIVRERIQRVLAALLPSDIDTVMVTIEADALLCQAYRFRKEDLYHYREGVITNFEIETLSPMREAISRPSLYDSVSIFRRKKDIWSFTFRPSLLNFFGSSKGKFKYSLGLIASPEGYLYDKIYYKFQLGYSIKSSITSLASIDRLNPSYLPQVRTDTLLYYQSNTVSMEQGFIQRGWNLQNGWFYRLACGYFEPAYGGGATELLYYPVGSNFAIGAEFASVLKRRYKGIAFTNKIRQFEKNGTVELIPFIGIQYFLDVYYNFKPLDVDVKLSLGQFLAKDKGIRTEVGHYFKNGLHVSMWYTITNGHDRVNGHTYYDKGVAFSIPLDFFMKQSSRQYINYPVAAWLRDVGARAETGKQLFTTLFEERWRY